MCICDGMKQNRQQALNAAAQRRRRERMRQGWTEKRVYVHPDDVVRFDEFLETLKRPDKHVPNS
jgi:hypothetical protein